ncbi:AsnC family protein [Salmonella enterica subsp. enterica]|nr:AsnC family protein [Salmonella enterica subsp. enterica]EEG5394274.1 AsnC family protein [Salmonella enterica subsp. enterica]EEG5547102.1 AsnC family protein [Salmonella enterica subsp. enterica]EEH5012218.1 AsnC family protein [Salmonella enterica]EKM5283446.1 AsnC family protein [Salmonella enterica]
MIHLKPMGTPGKCPAHLRAWTPEEDELLVNLYPHMTSAQIATMQDRSIKAVECRIRVLQDMGRLTRKKVKLTSEQRSFIRANNFKMTAREVADALGIPVNTVWKEIRRQNISYRKYGDFHHSTKHPDSDIELIRQLRDEYNLTFREIGEKFDISADHCQHIYHRRHTAIDAIAREYLPR